MATSLKEITKNRGARNALVIMLIGLLGVAALAITFNNVPIKNSGGQSFNDRYQQTVDSDGILKSEQETQFIISMSVGSILIVLGIIIFVIMKMKKQDALKRTTGLIPASIIIIGVFFLLYGFDIKYGTEKGVGQAKIGIAWGLFLIVFIVMLFLASSQNRSS